MRNTILTIIHQPRADAGLIGHKLRRRGLTLEVRRPVAGHALPERLDDYVAVLVFGGVMSANDTHLDGIRAELDWLPKVLAAERPYLGVCLGAQLMARTLGAEVARHPEGLTEIGYFPIQATPTGRHLFPDTLHVYHWHNEGFGLPPGAELLASGERFPNQAFRYGKRVYGIQFHPEVTRPLMERWLEDGASQLTDAGAQAPDQHLQGHALYHPRLEDWLDDFIDHWLDSDRP